MHFHDNYLKLALLFFCVEAVKYSYDYDMRVLIPFGRARPVIRGSGDLRVADGPTERIAGSPGSLRRLRQPGGAGRHGP